MTAQLTALDRVQYYQQVSAFYNNNGWDRIKRHYKYIRLPNRQTENSMTVALTCISTFAFGFAKIGGIIGEGAQKVFYRFKEGKGGKIFGTGIGFVTGVAVGGYTYITLTEHNPNFETWRKNCLTESVKMAITGSYSDDEVLKNFTCPVSLCVMDVPAYTPAGVFYDMVYILNCPADSNGLIRDPLRIRNCSYTENEIIPDVERSIVIHKRARYLLRADLQAIQNQPELRSAIEVHLRETENNLELRYESGRDFLEDRRRTKAVIYEEYKREIAEFEKLYGTEWEADLDWNINWLNQLNERWLKFHPYAAIGPH